jgi:succinate dehydrogenase / fumarate reductase cytochrome b subunit
VSLFFRKSIIATSGLFLCIFLVVHLSANCILLLPEATARELYNTYSTTLRESLLIKIVSYVLYLSIILHVVYALIVTYKNKKAKPEKYIVNRTEENSSWSSQNMGFLGVLILLFLVVHLANFWARIKLGVGEEAGLLSPVFLYIYLKKNYDPRRVLFRHSRY